MRQVSAFPQGLLSWLVRETELSSRMSNTHLLFFPPLSRELVTHSRHQSRFITAGKSLLERLPMAEEQRNSKLFFSGFSSIHARLPFSKSSERGSNEQKSRSAVA